MRPIEVGDVVEALLGCEEFAPGARFICSGIYSGPPTRCTVCADTDPRCRGIFLANLSAEDPRFGPDDPWRPVAWSGCAFVPIFPRLCEEVEDIEEPVDA
jgi:hypothetical protein